MRIVFMGSATFSLPSLKALANNYAVIGVVTQPDRKAGRGRKLRAPQTKVLADQLQLPVIQPKRISDPSAIHQLRAWDPDLIVVAAYGQILSKAILNLPPLGCINVHASLLPRWRGAAPIHAAILNGDEETGITIMLMDEGMDTGPILKQEATPIENQESGGHLFSRLSELGAKVLLEALPDYAAGHLKPRSQNDSEATYAPRIKKSQGLLDFTKTAAELALQVRAFEPWPTSFTIWKNLRIVIRRAHAINTTLSTKGKIFNFQEFPAVSTAKGSLVLDEVQPAGRKRMSGADFMHGKPEFLDTILAQAES